jgi:hypothetical protein
MQVALALTCEVLQRHTLPVSTMNPVTPVTVPVAKRDTGALRVYLPPFVSGHTGGIATQSIQLLEEASRLQHTCSVVGWLD